MLDGFIPTDLTGWLGLAGMAALGAFGIWGIIDRNLRRTRQEADEAETRLVNALKDEVEGLNRKVDKQDAKISDMSTKMERSDAENKLMRELLQGKDEDSEEYKRQGLVAMKQVGQVLEIVTSNNDSITKLYESLNKHFERIEKIEAAEVSKKR